MSDETVLEKIEEKQVAPTPVTDLSPRVIRLARMIDRLSLDANYVVKIKKPDTKDQRWQVEIIKITEEPIRTTEL